MAPVFRVVAVGLETAFEHTAPFCKIYQSMTELFYVRLCQADGAARGARLGYL